MGIGINTDFYSVLNRSWYQCVVYIQPVGVRIQFDSHVMFGACFEDGIPVEWVTLTAKEQSASRVAQNSCSGVFYGSKNALGCLFNGHFQVRVHRSNDKIKVV